MPTALPVRLDRDVPDPLPTQLAEQIRALVLAGTLSHGDRLPSSRALAADLHVSRAVTEQGYEQLVAEGWLATRHGAGTYVAPESAHLPAAPTRPSTGPGATTAPTPVQFDTGTPWIDPRHQDGWRRAWREVSVASPPRGYDHPDGLPELRTALAQRLARTRGLRVAPEEILVTGGTTDGLRQLLGVLPAGDIGVEDPGYRSAVLTVETAGRRVVDLPAGEPVTSLDGLRAAYVTPAHQHPLGHVMTAAERLRLLESAARADAVIIEDDFDSELRYDVAPVPALAALDRDRVAYLGTASKSAHPALRLGWMVPPPALLDELSTRRQVLHDLPSWPAQRALVTLLREGWLDKVVRSARRVYARRAPRVAAAMAPYAELAGPLAGMYATWLMPEAEARRGFDAALAAGYELRWLGDYARSSDLSGLVIGFGGVSDAELDAALVALTRALAGRGHGDG